MAGDDVPEKKPDPSIYKIAAQRIKVDPAACLVVEDSMIGLQVSFAVCPTIWKVKGLHGPIFNTG